jgi:hypothetical protein
VFGSKFGADCNLLWSPLNVNVCCDELELLPPLVELLLLAIDGRNNAHGTATCLPLLELLELEVLEALEVPPLLPLWLNETMAKSTLPDCGLISTSCMVPMFSPEDEVMFALDSSVAFTSCWFILPVALRRPELELLLPDEDELSSELAELGEPDEPRLLSELLPELPAEVPGELLLDEPCACAAVTRHAAQKLTAAMIVFLIPAFPFFVVCFSP